MTYIVSNRALNSTPTNQPPPSGHGINAGYSPSSSAVGRQLSVVDISAARARAATNRTHVAAAVDRWDRQTDIRTDGRTDIRTDTRPLPHTTRPASIAPTVTPNSNSKSVTLTRGSRSLHRRIKGEVGHGPPKFAPTSYRRGHLVPLECKKTF